MEIWVSFLGKKGEKLHTFMAFILNIFCWVNEQKNILSLFDRSYRTFSIDKPNKHQFSHNNSPQIYTKNISLLNGFFNLQHIYGKELELLLII